MNNKNLKHTCFQYAYNIFLSFAVLVVALLSGGCANFEEIKHLADAGDIEMQFQTAIMFKEGIGTPIDNQLAEKYLNNN